jgi:hypothetical protein
MIIFVAAIGVLVSGSSVHRRSAMGVGLPIVTVFRIRLPIRAAERRTRAAESEPAETRPAEPAKSRTAEARAARRLGTLVVRTLSIRSIAVAVVVAGRRAPRRFGPPLVAVVGQERRPGPTGRRQC